MDERDLIIRNVYNKNEECECGENKQSLRPFLNPKFWEFKS